MNRLERANEPITALLEAQQGMQAHLWTALPGIINTVDLAKQTCTVQPAVQMKYTDPRTQAVQWLTLPLLLDVPLQFPQGGGFSLTFPVRAGDECLVVFASRCIDDWWANGGVQRQPDLRMHDLSDGFAIMGFRSQPRVLVSYVADATELRHDSGLSKITITDDLRVHLVSNAEITMTAPQVTIIGSIVLDGSMVASGDVVANAGATAISLTSHRHGGVDTGSGTSGVPVP